MKTKYVEITYSQFQSLMDEMGFKEIVVPGVYERIWSFVIVNTPYEIRVFSSINVSTDVSRNNGKDAIRCMMVRSDKNKTPIVSYTVYRTKSALQNVKKQCRVLWLQHKSKCPHCDGIMVERLSKTKHRFMGCSNYPVCTHTANKPAEPSAQLKMSL